MLKAQRALLSVYDKRGLVEFARGLVDLGIELLSTGGTAKVLADNGLPVVRVSEVTGHPEILGGRVKTLHPRIHGGILADRQQSSHLAELREHGINPIDLVAVNLYPFRETAGREGVSFEEVVESIDIGGPTMVRAAAKNHQGVAIVVDPDDYPQVLAALENSDRVVPETLRRQLAIKAFRHTESHDSAISEWLDQEAANTQDAFPPHLHLDLKRQMEPRYGENPHQQAALYRVLGGAGVLGGFEQLQGKELSFNNLLDADAARRLVAAFRKPAVVIVKHGNPCGVGTGESPAEAFERALACDPTSAFGSIVALNRPANGEFAAAMKKLFVEVIVGPAFSEGATERFGKKKNLRLLKCPPFDGTATPLEIRPIDGGFVVQTQDVEPDNPAEWTCPTQRQPTDDERTAMALAWRVCRYVRSNAIVVANAQQTVGIGAGQMSRVDSCQIAIAKAELEVAGCAAGSDAFFPFRDGLDVLGDAGVTAVVQPGGSKRDQEVIDAADERGMTMLLTGRRHFKH
jgi:phosphoribosylaminoimidazolecarboxamide formyltransferase/IMP cyclohydrolase